MYKLCVGLPRCCLLRPSGPGLRCSRRPRARTSSPFPPRSRTKTPEAGGLKLSSSSEAKWDVAAVAAGVAGAGKSGKNPDLNAKKHNYELIRKRGPAELAHRV